MQATLTKVGNSMAVLLPKKLRQQAAIGEGAQLNVETPRKGVVVITALERSGSRLEALSEAEARIAARSTRVAAWPAGETADNLIVAGKRSRAAAYGPESAAESEGGL